MERTAMENLVLLKLIFRNWWRNKLFAVISLVSLVVGISCTNLLISFVIHEYTIEGENPKKDRILRLTQRLPIHAEHRTSIICLWRIGCRNDSSVSGD